MEQLTEKEILEAINKVLQYLNDTETESDAIDNLLYELRDQLI